MFLTRNFRLIYHRVNLELPYTRPKDVIVSQVLNPPYALLYEGLINIYKTDGL